MLCNKSPFNTMSITTNASDVNRIMKSNNKIDGDIENCSYSFINPLRTAYTPSMPMIEAENLLRP